MASDFFPRELSQYLGPALTPVAETIWTVAIDPVLWLILGLAVDWQAVAETQQQFQRAAAELIAQTIVWAVLLAVLVGALVLTVLTLILAAAASLNRRLSRESRTLRSSRSRASSASSACSHSPPDAGP